MNLEKSTENSRSLIRKFKEKSKENEFYLEPVHFINLLNDGATQCKLNSKRFSAEKKYTHYAVYEGILIHTNTSTEINSL